MSVSTGPRCTPCTSIPRFAKSARYDCVSDPERAFEAVYAPRLTYLGQWRLELAARDLRHGIPERVIAHRVGYASEFAFSRAFTRARGVPPGKYRTLKRVDLAG